ncbi:MAG: permease, partial [Anaerolineales bacterium]
LATLVGAFSPFCSCSVIPLVAALLIGGVPLAPVMSFWIASPSMDPEIFFLSVAMLGWELAAVRLLTTLLLSLSAGFATHWFVQRGWLGEKILRTQKPPRVLKMRDLLQTGWMFLQARVRSVLQLTPAPVFLASQTTLPSNRSLSTAAPGTAQGSAPLHFSIPAAQVISNVSSSKPVAAQDNFWKRLLRETSKSVLLVVQFMALAFFLEALITLYVPESWVAGLVGRQSPFAILTAALMGVPVYTSNLTALPMISGLLAQGMNPAAALAFLIAGPTTTLPAMSAVWGLVSRRVFALYVAFSLVGAVLFGYLYQILLNF